MAATVKAIRAVWYAHAALKVVAAMKIAVKAKRKTVMELGIFTVMKATVHNVWQGTRAFPVCESFL